MTNDEFIDLVRRMREAQISYFKTRDNWQKQKAMSLERQVDKVLLEMRSGEKQSSIQF